MDDEHSGGAKLRRLVVLVGPAAVVRHRIAAEHLRVQCVRLRRIERDRRIVHEHDERLAFDVESLEVIPLELGRLHAVADEHHFRLLDAHRIGHARAERDDLIARPECLRPAATRYHER